MLICCWHWWSSLPGANFAVIKVGVVDAAPVAGGSAVLLAAFPVALLLRPPKVPLRLYLLYGMTISVAVRTVVFSHPCGHPAWWSLVLQSQSFFTMLLPPVSRRLASIAGVMLAAAGLVLIGSAHGLSMPLAGFLLTVAAAVMWACATLTWQSVPMAR